MDTRPCRWCAGTGHRQTDNIPHYCEDCDGSGKEYLCPICAEWANEMQTDHDEDMCTECREKVDDGDYFGVAVDIARNDLKNRR